MSEPYRQSLPDLAAYRRDLVSAGAPSPLPLVPFSPAGLLARLPSPPTDRTGWPWTVETPPSATGDNPADWPLISIVTPSFKQAEFLEETIRSVLLQNYPRLEFVIMDGGSTDPSPVIIEKYRPWLSFARVARDRGQAHAINLGFSLAGDHGLRGWLNSDDLYTPGALHRVARAWRTTHADFFYGDGINLDHERRHREVAAAEIARGRFIKFAGLVFSHAAFWHSSIHAPIWEEQFCALDYELWIRLLPGRRTHHIAWPLGVFRQHGAAKSYSPEMKRRWDEDARRNGLAHPHLYRPNRWLDFEFKLLRRLLRPRRERTAAAAFAVVCAECGWAPPAA